MFGYVRLYKPTIRMGEYEQYKGVYCTLCRRLGKRYGLLARFTLNYDMTFLAVLYMALEENDPDFCRGHCSFNPTKRCLKCRHTVSIDRVADIGVLLTYYKLRDTLDDERGVSRIGAAVMMPIAAGYRRRARKRDPEADAAIAAMMEKQRQVEQKEHPLVDEAAEPFAQMLAFFASREATDEKSRRILSRFGYCLGRWVYFTDAVEDYEDDIKKGNFNPFTDGALDVPLRERTRPMLNACQAECISTYNLLGIRRFDGILRNVIEEGMGHQNEPQSV